MRFFQSLYSICPRFSRARSMRASPASMRSISSYFDISSEKISTGILWMRAQFMATLTAQLVLPTPGRAATMIRFSGCSPAVMWSNLVKPVGTPVISFRSRARSSMLSRTSLIISPTELNVSLRVCWATLKTAFSASSRNSS